MGVSGKTFALTFNLVVSAQTLVTTGNFTPANPGLYLLHEEGITNSLQLKTTIGATVHLASFYVAADNHHKIPFLTDGTNLTIYNSNVADKKFSLMRMY